MVFYEPPVFAIPTQEEYMKCWNDNYVQVENGFQICSQCLSITNTIYATNPRDSEKCNPILVFYGPPVFAISAQEEYMKY